MVNSPPSPLFFLLKNNFTLVSTKSLLHDDLSNKERKKISKNLMILNFA